MTFRGDIESTGRPLMTAPAPPASQRAASRRREASIQRTHALGKRISSSRAKSEPNSTRVRSCSGTPRLMSAWVNAPVPDPSSITGPVSGVISCVIRSARAVPDGVTEATRNGALIQARKKDQLSEARMPVLCPEVSSGATRRLRPALGGILDDMCSPSQWRPPQRLSGPGASMSAPPLRRGTVVTDPTTGLSLPVMQMRKNPPGSTSPG